MRLTILSVIALFIGTSILACEDSSSSDSPPGSTTTPDGGGSVPAEEAVTPEELARGGDCPAASGAGTTHSGFIEADETWTAAAGPHRVETGVRVTATLTIEPCAKVILGPGATLEVGTSNDKGTLIAKGEVTGTGADRKVQSITFDAVDAANPWGQIAVGSKGAAQIAVAAILNGGGVSNGLLGALVSRGDAGGTNDGEIIRNVAVDRVLVEKSASHGVVLDGWAAFGDGSRALWVRSSGRDDAQEAIQIEPGIASTLPVDLSLTGNKRDQILVETSKTFTRDDTFVARGVPYRIKSSLYINASKDAAPVTTTIEAGVSLLFEAAQGIVVGSTENRLGLLVAEGTAAEPVVFGSAADAKAAGDWSNITFRYTPQSGNKIRFAKIEYAGGESGASGFGCGPGDNDSAVIIRGQGPTELPPSDVFIKDTTFDNIAGTTVIVSGWIDDSGPNFSQGNTFGGSTPSCRVSRPKRSGAGDTCDGGRKDSCWG